MGRNDSPRMKCYDCGGWFTFYVPRGGDGSGMRLRAHDNVVQGRGYQWIRERCIGSFDVRTERDVRTLAELKESHDA